MNLKFLAIITARGGSKGIKDKNIIGLNNKPLIEYTITPAQKLLKEGIIDKLIVSTDSKKIARVAQCLGVEVPFLRPAGLATDSAKSIDVVLHAINHFTKENIIFDSVIILQPTSPLRTYEDLKLAVELYNMRRQDSLITAYKEETINELTMYKKMNNFAIPLNPNHNKGIRRQEHEIHYIRNGAIFITRVSYLMQEHKLISDRPLMFVMPKNRSLNLDTSEDLELLKWLLKKLEF